MLFFLSSRTQYLVSSKKAGFFCLTRFSAVFCGFSGGHKARPYILVFKNAVNKNRRGTPCGCPANHGGEAGKPRTLTRRAQEGSPSSPRIFLRSDAGKAIAFPGSPTKKYPCNCAKRNCIAIKNPPLFSS